MTASQAGLDAFLASNELWGGSGSIADCAGGGGRRSEVRRVLIQLGKEQMRADYVNPRTEVWVTTFSKWDELAISSSSAPPFRYCRFSASATNFYSPCAVTRLPFEDTARQVYDIGRQNSQGTPIFQPVY